jgi:transcriptional regulator with XRE-family HTH domain
MRKIFHRETLKIVGEQIREARINQDLTQVELGKLCDTSGKYISEIERGERDIPISTLGVIARRLRREIYV